MNKESVKLTFLRNSSGELSLTKSTESLALPPPSSDLGDRKGITGTWVQLEDENKTVLYRIDLPFSMDSSHDNSDTNNEYDVLIPKLPGKLYVAVYNPPVNTDGALLVGEESVLALKVELGNKFHVEKLSEPILPCDICGKGRGMVRSKITLHYNGRTDYTYNFVLLADRFYKNEDEKFCEKAQKCIQFLLSRPPFNNIYTMGAINIYLVCVESYKNTPYFDTQFKSGSDTLITWNIYDVKKVCDALFSKDNKPYWNWAGIITNNTSKRVGTAISSKHQFAVGTYSDGKYDEAMTFQHEFGHVAFNLADEYSVAGTGKYPKEEPNRPNVTKELDRNKLKWKRFLTPLIPIPTKDKDCINVGCYEGACTYEKGIYRPQYQCVMKSQEEVDGYYCRICSHEAAKIMAHGIGKFVPIPGSLHYSGASGKWENLVVAGKITKWLHRFTNYSYYDEIINEMKKKIVGPYVKSLFEKVEVTFNENVTLYEARFDNNYTGLWYLITSEHEMYYLDCFGIDIKVINIGKICLPSYPIATIYDGVISGTQMHLFCGDNGKLSYAQQNSYGEIQSGFVIQDVKGLSTGAQITAVSTDYAHSQIMVAVVDAQDVKIAAYQLPAKLWHPLGFIKMSVGSDKNNKTFHSVKISQSENFVHTAARSDGGSLTYHLFNITSMKWELNAEVIVAKDVINHDICTDGNNIYVVANNGTDIYLYKYNAIEQKWNTGEIITKSLGIASGKVITSLSCDILNKNLYVVVLINNKPKYASYNIITSKWDFPLKDIEPLLPLSNDIEAMMLHAGKNELHLILSKMADVSSSIESIF